MGGRYGGRQVTESKTIDGIYQGKNEENKKAIKKNEQVKVVLKDND